ncbi:BTAD domain-containing putative transcriptional regulator [Nonomuraea sp. NPDC049695]|uniref:AfsR/SARP family transcriptional regulator n=1 Tax=Nonomuraea sp. NPDC049695 TaxID=3154734 RepID=UPI003423D34B
MRVEFGVLGPVAAWDGAGGAIGLKGPRHRAVLARLIVARGRVVPVARLVADLWEDPPSDAVGAVRTFVAALRRALEPARPPRAPARLLVTEGPGYALRAEPHTVDAWRFERAVAASGPPAELLERLEEALGWWRGPAYADFADEPWARAERSRLTELRLHAVERLADTRLTLGLAGAAVPDLDAHVADHPWREEGWRLLALALYRTGRQGDGLAVLRRARTLLAEHLGVDPGPALRRLENDILHHAHHLSPSPAGAPDSGAPDSGAQESGVAETGAAQRDVPRSGVAETGAAEPGMAEAEAGAAEAGAAEAGAAEAVWARAAAAYDRSAPPGARARLESTVALMRGLAVTGGGGLQAAREHRVAAIAAAEELGDVELTARVIGAYDVPAIWTRLDDPDQAAQVIAAAERALTVLPPDTHDTTCGRPSQAASPPTRNAIPTSRTALPRSDGVLSRGARDAARARLLATIGLESRGAHSPRGPQAAQEAERLARRLDDPRLLAFALNAVFMQTFHRAGLATRRDAIGAELIALSARHGLITYEVLGHLIRLQARCALADFPGADAHARTADRLAERYELPLVGVFTQWFRALRLDATGQAPVEEVESAYRAAAARLDGAGMPGLEHGLLPLALLCLRLRGHARPPAQPTPPPREGLADEDARSLRAVTDQSSGTGSLRVVADEDADFGPYEPWARPVLLLAQGRRDEAAAKLRRLPDPPRDLLLEAMWCLVARAAVTVGDREAMERAHAALAPAAEELAGAGSGLLTLGPVSRYLDDLAAALRR